MPRSNLPGGAAPNGRYVEYISQFDELTTSRLAIENEMAAAPGVGVEWERDNEAHGNGDRHPA